MVILQQDPVQESNPATEGLILGASLKPRWKWEGCIKKGIWPKPCAKVEHVDRMICYGEQPKDNNYDKVVEKSVQMSKWVLIVLNENKTKSPACYRENTKCKVIDPKDLFSVLTDGIKKSVC